MAEAKQPREIDRHADAAHEQVDVARLEQRPAGGRPPERAADEGGQAGSARAEADAPSRQGERQRREQAADRQAHFVTAGRRTAEVKEQLGRATAAVEDRCLEVAGLKGGVVAEVAATLVPDTITEQAVVKMQRVPAIQNRGVAGQLGKRFLAAEQLEREPPLARHQGRQNDEPQGRATKAVRIGCVHACLSQRGIVPAVAKDNKATLQWPWELGLPGDSGGCRPGIRAIRGLASGLPAR